MNTPPIHEVFFPIAWGDMDALGHMNNARYLDYFQEARIQWLKELGIGLTGSEGPVVVHISATFFKPVIYPATVTVRSKVHDLGRSSMMMAHELYQEEQLMTQGNSKLVWVDYRKNKSVPLPQNIRLYFTSCQ